jgi:two-component sensor histidine kinase
MCILVVPLAFLGFWQINAVRNDQYRQIQLQAEQIANDRRADLDRTLTYYIAILQTLSASPSIDDGNMQRLYAQSAAILGPLGIYALMRDLSGQQLFNTRVAFDTPLPREVGFDSPVFSTKRPYVSDVVVGAVAKSPVVGLSAPVLRKNELRSIITLSLEPRIFSEMLSKGQLDPWWNIELVDRRGVVVAGTSPKDIPDVSLTPTWAFTAPNEARPLAPEGTARQLIVARESVISGWHVVVYLDQEQIDKLTMRPTLHFVAGVVGIIAVAYLLAVLLGRTIVSSLNAAVEAAQQLGRREPVNFRLSTVREANVLGKALAEAAAERDAYEQQIKVLMLEVSHRSKNFLAVIQSMVGRTSSASVNELKTKLSSRLRGLATSQDTLVKNDWKAANLRQLVEAQLAPFVDPKSARVHISGPELDLSAAATQSLGMAFHELCTNASKYGGLAHQEGSVDIEWRTTEGSEPAFEMTWKEKSHSVVKKPTETGFGYLILKTVLETVIGGKVDIRYRRNGFVWHLAVPLANIRAEDLPLAHWRPG